MCKPGYLLVPAGPIKFSANAVSVDKTVELYDFIHGSFLSGPGQNRRIPRFCPLESPNSAPQNFYGPARAPNWALQIGPGPGSGPGQILGPGPVPGPNLGPGPAQRNFLGLKSGFRVDKIMEFYDFVQTPTKTTCGQNPRILTFCQLKLCLPEI